jgi:prevent-host-death family protein
MKAVRIADLKAHLSEHLRAVRRGHPITVLDRDTPIATIEPVRPGPPPLKVRKGKGSFKDIKLPPPLKLDFDIVELLMEDRRKR